MSVSYAEVESYVLTFFRRRWSQAVEATDLRTHLLLHDDQIWGIGLALHGWRGVNYRADEFLSCRTIKQIIRLIHRKLTGQRGLAATGARSFSDQELEHLDRLPAMADMPAARKPSTPSKPRTPRKPSAPSTSRKPRQ